MRVKLIKNIVKSVILGCVFFVSTSQATVVEVRTVLGNFQINLFDETTPLTVQNFLQYVNSGAYANNVVHRSVDGFVIQSGGFTYVGPSSLGDVATGSPVNNEPVLSNVRGTIAMAKLGGNENSATSQWFINLDDNSAGSSSLDTQNGGFTVFGQVLGDGMDIVDAIAALPTYNFGGAASSIPLRNYTVTDFNSNVDADDTHMVIVTDIVVIDASTVTNPSLNPTPNTLIGGSPTPNPTPNPSQPNTGGSGGGSIHFLLLLLVAIASIRIKQER